MRWCEENTLNFVKIYLDKECLWNTNHEWYKTKFKREIAYAEIVKEFEALTGKCMKIPEVKTKIKNLRSTYTQQVQKILVKSSPDAIYKPSLIWFHEMDRRLKYVPNARTPVADYNQDTQEADSDEAAWPSQDKTLSCSFDESSDPLNPLLYTDNEYNTIPSHGSTVKVKIEQDSSPEYSTLYQKRKKRKLKKSPEYIIRSQMETWYKEDEFDIYGKYIASQLRKMELQSALKIQLEIQNLMRQAITTASDD